MTMKFNLSLKLSAIILMLGLSACVKQRPYEEVVKTDVMSKNLISTDDLYLYVPSTTQAQRSAGVARPNWIGEPKLVKFQFTENSIKVLEQERDPRFAGNPTNAKPVMSIPVTYHSYRCQPNASNDCSNKEEEDPTQSWDQKGNFQIDPKGPDVHETNTLPIDLENLFATCYKLADSHFVDFDIQADSLNFEVENTYQLADPKCESDQDIKSLSDIAFLARNHYSFIKLSKAVSSDYTPVSYPEGDDQNDFGFFTTEYQQLSVDNNAEQSGKITYLNRWNPNRKEVVYYLDDSLKKPENATLKAASHAAFDEINMGLQSAGVGIHFTLNDTDSAKAGDLRASMILNVEDPEDGGLLGYGPTIANPLTGEIINGRVSMYSGNFRKYIKRAWDEYVDGKLNPSLPPLTSAVDSYPLSPVMLTDQSNLGAKAQAGSVAVQAIADLSSSLNQNSISTQNLGMLSSEARLEKMRAGIQNYVANGQKLQDMLALNNLKTTADVLRLYGPYMADEFNFVDIVDSTLQSQLKDIPIKTWAGLNEAQRKQVIDTILPISWKTVLIHEMGHNLGLRHNFAGSEDKANFPTKDELQARGFTREMPYSSVMDYGYKELDNLHFMGKYDVAALRYAYQRQVEVTDGKTVQLVPVKTTLADLVPSLPKGQSLKQYKYCTDEHVGINAGCRRFDEGTTYTEIAQFYVNSYEKYYWRRNFRNDAASFSLVGAHGDRGYASSAFSTMRNLQLFFEVYKRIQGRYHPTQKDWQTVDFLKDLDQATKIAQDFFVRVILTPDVLCALEKVDDLKAGGGKIDPTKAVIVPLNEVDNDAISCSEALFNTQYQVIGQGGKRFNSGKSRNNPNPYLDQIDVRGIWADKIYAVEALFQRMTGNASLDAYDGSYMDLYPGAAKTVTAALEGLFLDDVSSKVPFTFTDGQIRSIPVEYRLFGSHTIPQMLDDSAAAVLGLPSSPVHFLRVAKNLIRRDLPAITPNALDNKLMDLFSVQVLAEGSYPGDATKYHSEDLGSSLIVAYNDVNGIGSDLMHAADLSRTLGDLDQDRLLILLQQMLTKLQNAKPSSLLSKALALMKKPLAPKSNDLVPTDKERTALDKYKPEEILDFLQGKYEKPDHYVNLLQILAQ